MSFDDPNLAELFPANLDAIPAEHRVDAVKHPARYQIGKEVITLDRDDERLPVYSKIAFNQGGAMKPILVGWTPKIKGAEAKRAVDAAAKAWDDPKEALKWRRAPWEVRINAIERFSAALAKHTDTIATLLMYEIGKPYADAKKEVTRSIEYIDNTIVELSKLLDACSKTYEGVNGKTTHHARNVVRPSGLVLCVGPFNYPINELFTTVVPALLMGNPVIVKTPRFGVLANQLLMPDLAEIFPHGVISMLPGDGKEVIPEIMSAKSTDVLGMNLARIKTLAFIGTEGAAHAIAEKHPAQNFLTRILGLGAKNPALIMPGAKLSDDDLGKLVKGALGNNGQRCTAEKIIFVPDGAEGDAIVERISDRVNNLKLGMPWSADVAVTPLPEDKKLEAMRAYIEDATSKGARIANSGGGGGKGWHSIMRPAVLDRVAKGMRIYFEEQFGPVVPIVRYTDPLEAIAWERASPYGQQAGVWGPASDEKDEVSELMLDEVARLNVDDVCQRGPDSFGFTATEKSGYGTLSLREALLSFSRTSILQSPVPENIDPWPR